MRRSCSGSGSLEPAMSARGGTRRPIKPAPIGKRRRTRSERTGAAMPAGPLSSWRKTAGKKTALLRLRSLRHDRRNAPAFGGPHGYLLYEVGGGLGRHVQGAARDLRLRIQLGNIRGQGDDLDAIDVRIELPHAFECFLEVRDERRLSPEPVRASD